MIDCLPDQRIRIQVTIYGDVTGQPTAYEYHRKTHPNVGA
jgi:hypothetical protein